MPHSTKQQSACVNKHCDHIGMISLGSRVARRGTWAWIEWVEVKNLPSLPTASDCANTSEDILVFSIDGWNRKQYLPCKWSDMHAWTMQGGLCLGPKGTNDASCAPREFGQCQVCGEREMLYKAEHHPGVSKSSNLRRRHVVTHQPKRRYGHLLSSDGIDCLACP